MGRNHTCVGQNSRITAFSVPSMFLQEINTAGESCRLEITQFSTLREYLWSYVAVSHRPQRISRRMNVVVVTPES
jgi:acyl-[acyl carrier protein]--UDP-N-acetylglucosamine O-acyltransferase